MDTRIKREAVLTLAAVGMMAMKIWLGMLLVSRWRTQAIARGEAFDEEPD